MLILDAATIRDVLTLDRCIDAVAEVMPAISAGGAVQPMRRFLQMPDAPGQLGWMPGVTEFGEAAALLGAKLLTIFPLPAEPGRSRHGGIVILFDAGTGAPTALLEAGEITAMRTPAASAVATRVLAREEARSLAILGAGKQAEGHLAAMLKVRPIDRVTVWTTTPARADAFARTQTARHGVPVQACRTVEQAVAAADIVCTTTAAREPILRFHWLRPGTHVNVIGSGIPSTSEIDNETVAGSRFFVDHRETVEHQGGDYRRALAAGAIADGHIAAELGEVMAAHRPGRHSADDITVFKSVGLIAYDLAAASVAYDAARKAGAGLSVAFS